MNLTALDTLAVTSIQQAVNLRKIAIIDEIGPMELLSERFRDVVMRTLQSDATVPGTIAKRSTPFTDQIKSLPQVTLIEVHPDDRDTLVSHILGLLATR